VEIEQAGNCRDKPHIMRQVSLISRLNRVHQDPPELPIRIEPSRPFNRKDKPRKFMRFFSSSSDSATL
jgi:hypothetical protein